MEVTFKRNGRCATGAIFGLVWLLLGVAMLVAPEATPVERLMGLMLIVMGLWLGIRIWWVRVIADPAQVTLVNWVSSVHLDWDTIRDIDPPASYGRIRNGTLFTTVDGKVHAAAAYTPGPLDPASFTTRAVAQLRDFHERFGSPPPAES